MYARGTTTMNTAAPSKTHSNIFSNLSRQRRRQALYNAHAEAKSQSKVNYLLTLVLIRSRFWHVLFLVLRIFFLSLHSEMENGMMHSTRACIFSFSFILWIFQWQKWKQHSGIALPAAVASTSMQNNNRVRWKWQNPITLMHRRDAISSNMHYMYRFIVMHAHRTRNVYARLPGGQGLLCSQRFLSFIDFCHQFNRSFSRDGRDHQENISDILWNITCHPKLVIHLYTSIRSLFIYLPPNQHIWDTIHMLINLFAHRQIHQIFMFAKLPLV